MAASCAQFNKKRVKFTKKKKTKRTTNFAEEFSATTPVNAETPAPPPPGAAAATVPPVIQVPHGTPPQFYAPVPGTASVNDQSYATSQAYYGNAQAYGAGDFHAAPTTQSVLGHPPVQNQAPQQWTFPPQALGCSCGKGGPTQSPPCQISDLGRWRVKDLPPP